MTARSCRYCGSAAVMISELVDGSAWIWPPVDGCPEACTGAVAPPPPPGVVDRPVVDGVTAMEPPPPEIAPGALALNAARNVTASLAASAFLR